METVEYIYSPEFLKMVSREYLFKTRGWLYIFLPLLTLAALLFMTLGSTGFFAGGLVMFCIFEALTYHNYQQRAAAQASSLIDQSMSVTFANEVITFDNPDHVSIIKWRRIHSITKLKSAWLFATYNGSNYFVVPVALISDSIRNLIETKMGENGKRII